MKRHALAFARDCAESTAWAGGFILVYLYLFREPVTVALGWSLLAVSVALRVLLLVYER